MCSKALARGIGLAVLLLLVSVSAGSAEAGRLQKDEYLKTIDQIAAKGPFKSSWDSLAGYTVPQWYQDARFGIFIHWGLTAVPEYDCWYGRNMYQQGSDTYKHHVGTYGDPSKFGFKDLIPMFKAEKFDADRWARLFRDAGAKFVVPVAEHHDGFPNYDCSFSQWSAAKMGPKRDLIAALAKSVRKRGMVFGVSSHRAEHWWFMDGGMKFDSDVKDPRYADFYGPAQPEGTQPNKEFLDDWLARSCELVDKYKPQLVWFDWWIGQPAFEPYLQKFAAYYYNRGAEWKKGVAINYKFGAFRDGTAVLDLERGQLNDIHPMLWQTDTSVSTNSWFCNRNASYRTADSLVDDLVDIASKNGALLLNVGPRADGTIPEPEEKLLLEVGRWLKVNGEAIYGTRPWRKFGEGPTEVASGAFTDTNRGQFTGQDIRFTTKGNTLYAICLAWPGDKVTIKSLSTPCALAAGDVKSVRLLGHNGKLRWSRDENGLTVELPKDKPCDHAYVLKITGLDPGSGPQN